ncbi:MAG: hypothetical protein WC640_01395 [Candidatus Paceibacterota bacterium]|jgi:hypothetical protein
MMANLLHVLNIWLEKNKRMTRVKIIIGVAIAKGKPREKALDFNQKSAQT